MTRAAMLLCLLPIACHAADEPGQAGSGGARLEAAAVASGLVVDPRSRSLTGAWSLDTDRACVVPDQGGKERIGILIDYGAGQGCAGTGTAERRGASTLAIRFGDCQITARFDGDRIVFPPEVAPACDRLCVGRASIAALTVERQSESVAEAANLRTPGGRSLCGS